ncbi:MAG: class I SAM-dependent methyltransferase [Treponema sp.]|jgi:23S rRNA G2069 N7-methylase RlmK/C1962 C5-methylase RlmI|nr:class I SAM-dependent methyltransferase [Treponema sp.]
MQSPEAEASFRRVFGKTAGQAEMFANRLVKRRRHLSKWARRSGAGAYLLYDRDIPEVPLRVEYYPDLSASGRAGRGALSLSLYRRPYYKAGADEDAWLAAMKTAAAERLGLDTADIFFRLRERQRNGARYGRAADTRALREVCEYGLRYRVNLSDYLDTGLFLDRRLFRALVRSAAAGRRVLNLFCYTGSVSVAAADGGAAAVDSVDISNTYLDWARENFALNGLYPLPAAPGQDEGPFRFIRADALRFVEQRVGETWDIIILDPPAFSNSQKMAVDFDLRRDHPALISRCLKLLEPDGTLYFSANSKGFAINRDALPAALDLENITEKLRDEDYRGKRIPEAYRISPRTNTELSKQKFA